MSDNKKNDLTNIFDLSDFNHEEDPETEAYFKKKQEEDISNDEELDDADDEVLSKAQSDDNFETKEMTQVNFNPQSLIDDDKIENLKSIEPLESEVTEVVEVEEIEDDFNDWSEDTYEDSHEGIDEAKEVDSSPLISEEEITETLAAIASAPTTKNHRKSESVPISNEKKYENFEDVNRFAQNSNYGQVSANGNPPFSMIISKIQFQEDANHIFSLLKEYGFVSSSTEGIMKKSLDRGSAIISRVSEFALIFLYHKLHSLPVTLAVGPSDILYHDQSSQSSNIGKVSSKNILQNKEDSHQFKHDLTNSVLFSSNSQIDGYITKDFLGHCSQSTIIQVYPEVGNLQQSITELESRDQFEEARMAMMDKLKDIIDKKNGNAGLDLKTSTTPLFNDEHKTFEYEITAECNAAWIEKSNEA